MEWSLLIEWSLFMGRLGTVTNYVPPLHPMCVRGGDTIGGIGVDDNVFADTRTHPHSNSMTAFMK